MTIIPATLKVEFGRITVQDQPRKKVSKIPSQPTSQEWWVSLRNPGRTKKEECSLKPALDKNMSPYPKNN
jgi:hypothetical protein